MVNSFRQPIQQMLSIASEMMHPDFATLQTRLNSLSFEECANYMMFYLRLAYSQGGGDSFVAMWKDGTAANLTERMLATLDECNNR